MCCDHFFNKQTIRDYAQGDYAMNSILASVNWDELLKGDTTECLMAFRDLLLKLETEYVQLRRKSCHFNSRKPVWMSYKALKLVHRKRKIFNKSKDANHPAVKSACRASRIELRRSRRNFEKKLALNIKNDSKSFFAYSRSHCRSKTYIGPLLNDSGNMTVTDAELVDSFNNHFVSVFTAEDISTMPTCASSFVPLENLCSDITFTHQDVLHVLMKLIADKAVGPDELSARFLIQIKDNIVYPLFIIFRKSLDEGLQLLFLMTGNVL